MFGCLRLGQGGLRLWRYGLPSRRPVRAWVRMTRMWEGLPVWEGPLQVSCQWAGGGVTPFVGFTHLLVFIESIKAGKSA